MSDELEVDLPVLVHHINVLVELGCIELVKTEPRGGAIEHFYRGVRLPEISSEEWQRMASGHKQELAAGYVRNLFGEALASILAGKMAGDPNVYVWWKAIDLDEQGRKEAEEEQTAHVGRLLEIEARANERMAQKPGQEQTLSTVLAILGFARPNH